MLAPDAPYQVMDARWSRDGTRVVSVANHGVHTQLMQLDVATGGVTALTEGRHTIGAWRVNDRLGGHVFTVNTAERPAEVHLLTGTGPMRRVTRVFEVALRPNYRGGTGYGDAFLRDMVGGYFKQAHLDLLAGAVLFRIQVELEWFDRWLSGREYRWETAPAESAPDKTATRP